MELRIGNSELLTTSSPKTRSLAFACSLLSYFRNVQFTHVPHFMSIPYRYHKCIPCTHVDVHVHFSLL
jgi:hypothetical protein